MLASIALRLDSSCRGGWSVFTATAAFRKVGWSVTSSGAVSNSLDCLTTCDIKHAWLLGWAHTAHDCYRPSCHLYASLVQLSQSGRHGLNTAALKRGNLSAVWYEVEKYCQALQQVHQISADCQDGISLLPGARHELGVNFGLLYRCSWGPLGEIWLSLW